MTSVDKSPEQSVLVIIEAAQAAERDARAFNKLLISRDPQIKRNERTMCMGLVWQFIAEYKRKMILLKGDAAVRDVSTLHAELVKEQQQLQELGLDGAELLCQFDLRRTAD